MLGGIGQHMPIKKTYWYSAGDSGEQRFELLGSMRNLCDVAMDAAADYHGNHDGFESIWPLTFTIYETEEGPAVARFSVERDIQPVFYAWREDK